MNTGIVYILTNEGIPDFIKIGHTTRSVEGRMRDLDKTGVPLPFECYLAARVERPEEVEKMLHKVFGCDRVRENREFFRTEPHRPAIVLRHIMLEDATPENLKIGDTEEEQEINVRAIREAKKKRSRFTFDMVGLSKGDILYSVFDPEITCVVFDNRKVEYKGKITSLSKLAAIIRVQVEGGSYSEDDSLQGPRYWKTEDGVSLLDLREDE